MIEITDQSIQTIKKNLPKDVLEIFQLLLTEYHETKQKLKNKERELERILEERNHFDKIYHDAIEDLKDKLNDYESSM